MYDYVGTVLCVEGGWLYEAGVMTMNNYRKLSRLYFNTLRGGGNGRTALIEWNSVPVRFQEKAIEITGDPVITTRKSTFKTYLEHDQKAQEFFNNYTLDAGTALPDRNIKEYTANAIVLNAIYTVTTSLMAKRRTLGGSKVKIWDKIAEVLQELPKHTYPHTLPNNTRRLKQKLKLYKAEGYETLIHKQFGNKNSEKINEDAKLWLVSRWADRVMKVANFAQLHAEYNRMCELEGWKPLKHQDTIKNYLHLEHVKNLWYGHRYGELKAKEKYTYFHTTKMSSMRDSLWYSDGTKLNYYYLDADGKIATCQVYEVMDTFSEVFLGYHISKTEDYEAQYYAYKMALGASGHKPYELKFDGQGGHGKLKAGNFLNKISRFANKTQPYNGKSKTIESAFGRFQQQILKQDWFYSGQNITAKTIESKANMEFILANKHNLPSLKEIKEVYAQRRAEWNNAKHYATGEARMEMYLNSDNPETPEVSLLEMVDLFWITREKPITCTPYGISFKEKKVAYEFSVYDADGMPDFEWLADNTDKKFIVKYDPSDMTLIYLYTKDALGLRRVGAATTKVVIHRNRQEQEAWELSYMQRINEANKRHRLNRYNEMEQILKDHKMSAEDYGLKNPKVSGIKSTYDKKNKTPNTIGTHQKQESNMDAELEYENSRVNDY